MNEATPLNFSKQAIRSSDDESYELEESTLGSHSSEEMPGDPPDIPRLSCHSFCCTPFPGRLNIALGLFCEAFYSMGPTTMLVYGACNNGTMPEGAPIKSSINAAIAIAVIGLPLVCLGANCLVKGISAARQYYIGPHNPPPPPSLEA